MKPNKVRNDRILFLILISLSTGIAQAQIKYQAYFKYLANDSIALNNCDIYLGDRRQAFHDSFFLLKEAGEYLINFTGEHQIKIKIDTTPYQSDTFIAPQLAPHLIDSEVQWFYGDKIANGPITDYHLNGNKRIEATFEDGSPIDTFYRFYDDENIEEISIYQKRNIQTTEYYASGNLKTDYDRIEKIRKDYYENGALKIKSNYNRKLKQSIFSIDGSLLYKRKGRRVKTYYHNGTIKDKIVWRPIINHFLDYYKGGNYYRWKTFDSTGTIKSKIETPIASGHFNILHYRTLPENLHFGNIGEIILYNKGKKNTKIIRSSNVDGKDTGWMFAVYTRKGLGWKKTHYISSYELYQILSEECY
ncbi:hypothetical protein GYB22_01415 [bacterium]|nr:hypothetical protein [bacterium]